MSDVDRLRLDKWLWAARLYKTRALAVEAIERGRVSVNDQPAKPSRELRCGDRVAVRHPPYEWQFVVRGLDTRRGPAAQARLLYEENADSIARREAAVAQRRLSPEPSQAIAQGRPTKRDRRQLAQWQRWSASTDDA
jgi:ribosome-associated heat shock protein Hsp15